MQQRTDHAARCAVNAELTVKDLQLFVHTFGEAVKKYPLSSYTAGAIPNLLLRVISAPNPTPAKLPSVNVDTVHSHAMLQDSLDLVGTIKDLGDKRADFVESVADYAKHSSQGDNDVYNAGKAFDAAISAVKQRSLAR